MPVRQIVILAALVVLTACRLSAGSDTALISSPSPSPSPAPISATSSLTPIPTLTEEQAIEFLEEMVRTNGGCELPCFWGGAITPGVTTRDEARAFFDSLHLPERNRGGGRTTASFTVPLLTDDGEYDFDALTNQGMEDYSAWIVVFGHEEMVSTIEIGAYAGNPYTPSSRFNRVLNGHYGWELILNQNGPPSEVLVLQIESVNYVGPSIYGLMLLYGSLGMAIQYRGLLATPDIEDSAVRYCPNFGEVTRIELILTTPRSEEEFPELIRGMQEHYWGWLPLVEMTGMTVEDFYESFRSSDSTTCLQHRATP